MISRAHRFHGRGSLNFVHQNGRTIRGPLGNLKYSLNRRRKSYRLAVVVSKKISKSAVVRNRIRRRIFEIVRLHQDVLLLPYDMVYVVFDIRVATMPAVELQVAIQKQLQVMVAQAEKPSS